MWAYATNRVHGLGLTSDEFWNSTPRELAAHGRVFERGPWMQLNAAVMAALHNGPATRRDGKPWTADMFLPGYRPDVKKDESWKVFKRGVMAYERKVTPEERETMTRQADEFKARQARAVALKASGASREQIVACMEGR